jgi:hypothetical protein
MQIVHRYTAKHIKTTYTYFYNSSDILKKMRPRIELGNVRNVDKNVDKDGDFY